MRTREKKEKEKNNKFRCEDVPKNLRRGKTKERERVKNAFERDVSSSAVLPRNFSVSQCVGFLIGRDLPWSLYM